MDSARLGGCKRHDVGCWSSERRAVTKLHCMHACVGNRYALERRALCSAMSLSVCLAYHIANGSSGLCVECVNQFLARVLHLDLICYLAGAKSYMQDKQCGVAMMPAVSSLGTSSIPS